MKGHQQSQHSKRSRLTSVYTTGSGRPPVLPAEGRGAAGVVCLPLPLPLAGPLPLRLFAAVPLAAGVLATRVERARRRDYIQEVRHTLRS